MRRAETVAAMMAAGAINLPIQVTQTAFRMSLVDNWTIRPAATVLEIGCGQGDMTAALAEAVGPTGRVVAVDIADPTYGAPVTLGESADVLRASPLGDRLDIRFGFDVLDAEFPDDMFDHVVLAQSSWYFASLDQLRRTLRVVRPWARTLCFAEWDLCPTDPGQLPHLLAVLVQGHLAANNINTGGNVRTPFSYQTFERLLAETGWQVDHRHHVATTGLQDADWEVAACLDLPDRTLALLPEKSRHLLTSQMDVLRSTARQQGNQPLPTYQVVASRQGR